MDSPTVSYSYDSANISYGVGRLAKVTNGISTTTILSYDAEGRTLASQQSTAGKTYNLFYGYDLSGALTSETYPSGRQIATQFDGAGREKKIDGALGGQPSAYLSSVAYAPHGGVGSMQYGNNVWHEVNYNSRLQPYQALDVINNDPNQLLRAECLYWSGSYNLTACGAENHTDNNGNPRATVFWYGNGGTSVSASFNETFAYDGVNRLTGVVDNGGWSRYFAYDQYSNMWLCGWPWIAPNGAAPTANYCSQTPSGIFNTANRIGTGSYDAAGNQLTVAGSNFSYDAENRVTTAAQPGIGTVTYTYDGDGRRVMKSVSTGLQTVYVYDIGGKLVAEYSSGATSVPPCHTCFLSTDHLGSTRLVTNENGNTVSRHDYIPFGEEIAANSGGRDSTFGTQDFVNQKFTGKERDQETGLDYFGARYYGSALGRFTSPDDPDNDQDPKDPQSWNLYSYVRNNPLKNIDPFGQDCITISNQTSSGATVTTERGGSAEACSGTYVEGTVNTNSYQYNGTSLSYSFSNDTASGAGTIAFSKYSNDDWAPGSSNMLGAAQIGGSQALVNEFMKQAVIGAAAGVAGRVIGAGVDAFLAARAARAAAAAVDLANLSNKIVRQMASRGWTTQVILETFQNGKAYNVVNKATGGAATEYVNPASGKFVVVDNATKQVLQVSGPGFSPNHLIQ